MPSFANSLNGKVAGNGHTTNGHLPVGVPALPGRSTPAPRILILSASCGSGHLRAAEALELAVRQLRPDAFVRNIDVLTLSTTPFFRRCYGQMYLDFINVAPGVLGFFYKRMDRPRSLEPSGWDRVRVALETLSLRPFVYLLRKPWDLVINTHFLPGEIIASFKRAHHFQAPQVMVITDFETHRMWATEPCEHYFTATEEGAAYLQVMGVPGSHTSVLGIPVHPSFSTPKSRAECLLRQGLRGDRPIVLQMSGGHCVGRIRDVYRALLEVEVPLEVVLVAGHNAQAQRELKHIPVPPRHRVKVIGYTRQIDELMTAADLVITKPGGLTTSELLAVGAAMVLVDPVPGQEERNSDYLLENGAAIKINHLATMPQKIAALLRDPDHLRQVRANARRLGRPRAAFDVVQRCLELFPPRGDNHSRPANGHHRPDRDRKQVPAGRPVPPAERLAREWQASRDWFDLLEIEALHLFARVWHQSTTPGPPTIPATGPAIVVANHPSYSDPAFLMAACLRPLRFLHARESFETFGLHHLFARVGSIPVGRDGQDVAAVRKALRLLSAGEAVCVFPEGEVHPDDADPAGPVRAGAAFLALVSKAPVYPALIVGGPQSHEILRDWLWPSHGVQVVFGPPVDLSAYYGWRLTRPLLQEVAALLQRRIAELRPVSRQRRPVPS